MMLTYDDIDELKEKKLCFHCVQESFLSAEIQRTGTIGECDYCEREFETYRIGQLADRIEEVFERHYRITPEQPDGYEYAMHRDKEIDYDWERRGEPTPNAIENAGGFPEEAAVDIQSILSDRYASFDHDTMGEETPFSDECHYEESPVSDNRWQSQWFDFERTLRVEARFLSRSATEQLERVFAGIHTLRTRSGRQSIVDAGPGAEITSLYRARVFQSEDQLKEALCRPDRHIGPPPAKQAASGRMNARGIAVFYGANEQKAALAEVRPPVGSRVAVAQFEIIRPLRLLDLEAMKEAAEGGSVFDPTLADRMGRAKFLRILSARITQPVLPDEQEFKYLTTQVIADYLATEYDPPIDGIVFKSVQAGLASSNVVLFHKSSRVELIDVPESTDLRSATGMEYEEGWEDEYSVVESYDPNSSEGPRQRPRGLRRLSDDFDARPNSLRVRRDTIRVHHVQRVEVVTDEHSVAFRRFPKVDPSTIPF